MASPKKCRAKNHRVIFIRARSAVSSGAWVSHQSEVIDARRILEARLSELEERFAGQEISCPPHWGGYRVKPERIEFWQGRPNRLHDRFRYTREGESWRIDRLAP